MPASVILATTITAAVAAPGTPGSLNFADVTADRVVESVPEARGPHMKEVAAGDFDNDGDLDIAIAAAAGTFGSRRNKMYRNDGGVFTAVGGTAIIPDFGAADVSRHAAFRDVDDDGWLDLVIVNDAFEFDDPLELFMNRHDGGVFTHFEEEGLARGLGYDWSCGAVSVDVDDDGDIDVYVANYGGSAGQDALYLNDGSGFFDLVTSTHVPSDTDFSIDAASGDMNGDGTLDVLVSNDDAPFVVYYNDLDGAGDGLGDFRYGAGGDGGVQSLGTSGGHGALEPADFDGDGDLDIYWTNHIAPTTDQILENSGTGPDGKATWTAVPVPAYPASVASFKSSVADLNGDGRVDVIVMTSQRPAILRNTSVGGGISFVDWTPATAVAAGPALSGAHAIALDSGGDGDLDIFIGSGTGDHLLEAVPTPEVTEASLGGVLPDVLDAAPLAVVGTAAPGETDLYLAGDLDDEGHLAVILNGPGDYQLDVLRDGGVVASSDRGGAGVEEALQVELDDGTWAVRVVAHAGAGPGTDYVLEILARGGDGLSNDDCDDAEVIGDGATEFTNVGAATDGPAHDACFDFTDDQVQADVWFLYRATCTGALTVSTCDDADYDTKIAVYADAGCPVLDDDLLGCNEDTAGCGNYTSVVTVSAIACEWYRIRVGGWLGAQGSGVLTLTCDGEPESCGLPGDVDQDGLVNVEDLTQVILHWGPCPGTCPADLDGDGQVGVTDLSLVLLNWT